MWINALSKGGLSDINLVIYLKNVRKYSFLATCSDASFLLATVTNLWSWIIQRPCLMCLKRHLIVFQVHRDTFNLLIITFPYSILVLNLVLSSDSVQFLPVSAFIFLLTLLIFKWLIFSIVIFFYQKYTSNLSFNFIRFIRLSYMSNTLLVNLKIMFASSSLNHFYSYKYSLFYYSFKYSLFCCFVQLTRFFQGCKYLTFKFSLSWHMEAYIPFQ